MTIDEDLEEGDDALFENEMEEEEDEGEEDEDNDSYNLKFYSEMDPLNFALKDSSNSDEIYQQFQRLEYEALAERKRKALLDPQNRGEQAKKLREEEDAAMEVINEFLNLGRRRRSKKMVQEGVLTALASVADSSQEHFQKYYDAFMPYLKAILMNATDKSNRMLRAKSMECISLVGMAVGKE